MGQFINRFSPEFTKIMRQEIMVNAGKILRIGADSIGKEMRTILSKPDASLESFGLPANAVAHINGKDVLFKRLSEIEKNPELADYLSKIQKEIREEVDLQNLEEVLLFEIISQNAFEFYGLDKGKVYSDAQVAAAHQAKLDANPGNKIIEVMDRQLSFFLREKGPRENYRVFYSEKKPESPKDFKELGHVIGKNTFTLRSDLVDLLEQKVLIKSK
jgi:hypothetical protein